MADTQLAEGVSRSGLKVDQRTDLRELMGDGNAAPIIDNEGRKGVGVAIMEYSVRLLWLACVHRFVAQEDRGCFLFFAVSVCCH